MSSRALPPRATSPGIAAPAEPTHRNACPALPDPSEPTAHREVWRGLRARRLALAIPSLVTAGGIAWLAALAYPAGVSPLAWAVLGLFGLVMAWQAFTACQYAYGLIATLVGDRAKSVLERRSEAGTDAAEAVPAGAAEPPP